MLEATGNPEIYFFKYRQQAIVGCMSTGGKRGSLVGVNKVPFSTHYNAARAAKKKAATAYNAAREATIEFELLLGFSRLLTTIYCAMYICGF